MFYGYKVYGEKNKTELFHQFKTVVWKLTSSVKINKIKSEFLMTDLM